MARKKFKGDAAYRVPEGMREPYLLWFLALKLAYQTPGLEVNQRFYREWGDIEDVKFDDWWREKWRDLFAVSIGVGQIESLDDFVSSRDKSSIIVRIPLDQPFKKTVEELKLTYEALPTKVRSQKPRGKFHLIGTSKMRLQDVYRYLMSYHLKLKGYSYKEAAYRYCKLIRDYEKKRGKRIEIQPGGWQRLLDALERGGRCLHRSFRLSIGNENGSERP